MRKQDTLTIANLGTFTIEAVYDYRLETSDKQSLPEVEKIELLIKRHYSKLDSETHLRINSTRLVRTIRLLDIPPWLWELLNDPDTLQELDREYEPGDKNPDAA